MTVKNLCYKLTDQQMRTRVGGANETRWRIGRRVSANLSLPPRCCTAGVIHAYTDPLVALLLNPLHAGIRSPRLFAAKWAGACHEDRGLKLGAQHLTLLEELPVPTITTTQRAAFGVLCGLEVCQSPVWRVWAERWLSGEDRSRSTAYAAYAAADAAAADAADANSAAAGAAYAAYAAADAAAYAADAAAYAADAAARDRAAASTAYAAAASAAVVAISVAHIAAAARDAFATTTLDFPMLAAWAMQFGK